jgi:hypothetical protein
MNMRIGIVTFLSLFIVILGCVTQNHASKGWKHIEKREYAAAKNEFELSLANDTLPGSLSGMSRALDGLNEIAESKKYLILLRDKFPTHRFTAVQIESWNKRFPNDPITMK